MDLPALTGELLPILVVGVGVLVAAAALRALGRRRTDRRLGSLVAVDAGASRTLASLRYRLAGRPDLVRRTSEGRPVPIELKSRAAPPGGPPRSHVVQVWAYCLLLEETGAPAPRFGVLRYSDGTEYRIPWDLRARAEFLRLRAEIDRPYDGRAAPSPAKCARCAWRVSCDARAGG